MEAFLAYPELITELFCIEDFIDLTGHGSSFSPVLQNSITAAGYPQVVQGGVAFGKALSIDFRYFDAGPDTGLYLEVLDFNALGLPLNLEPLIRTFSAAKKGVRRLLERAKRTPTRR